MPAAAAMRSGVGADEVHVSSPCPLIPCLDQARHHLGVARRDNARPGSNPPPPRFPPPRRAALFVPSLLRLPLGRRTSQGRGRHGRLYTLSSSTTARGAASPARAPSCRARSSSWAASHASPSRNAAKRTPITVRLRRQNTKLDQNLTRKETWNSPT
ncbi:uncharacterized protein [Triticum aestivum]|uniref:uncharacterized protein n=1 Tax=Triticum aestivum TaxID=4565 RepID=UPI001D03447A|nr:uncharacterized protein LOC123124856 [Triticum aestivum]